jgi:hypothetical protein
MALLAQELLAASAVFAILDHIGAVAFGTVKDYRLADHVSFIPSFRKCHYRIFDWVIEVD